MSVAGKNRNTQQMLKEDRNFLVFNIIDFISSKTLTLCWLRMCRIFSKPNISDMTISIFAPATIWLPLHEKTTCNWCRGIPISTSIWRLLTRLMGFWTKPREVATINSTKTNTASGITNRMRRILTKCSVCRRIKYFEAGIVLGSSGQEVSTTRVLSFGTRTSLKRQTISQWLKWHGVRLTVPKK